MEERIGRDRELWTLCHQEISLTHHHAPSILIAIGSLEPQEGFFMADEVMTTLEAAER
jgi:hypothetical protein